MRVFPEQSIGDREMQLAKRLEDWRLVVVPSRIAEVDECLDHDHWLGCSVDGRVWGLVITPYKASEIEIYESLSGAKGFTALLVDPPKRQRDTIAEILLRVHLAQDAGGPLQSPGHVRGIIATLAAAA